MNMLLALSLIIEQNKLWATSKDTSIHDSLELASCRGHNSKQGRLVTLAMLDTKAIWTGFYEDEDDKETEKDEKEGAGVDQDTSPNSTRNGTHDPEIV